MLVVTMRMFAVACISLAICMAPSASLRLAKSQDTRLKACAFFGESVLVTGGTSGIGLATAKSFIELGASRVHILGRSRDKGEAARQELLKFANGIDVKSDSPCRAHNNNGDDLVHYHSVDVGDISGNTSAMSQLLAKPIFQTNMCEKPLKYAVNSAGTIGFMGPTYTATPAALQDIYHGNSIRSNFEGGLWSMSAEWAYFRDVAKKCGVANFSIVAVSSVNAIRACPSCVMYAATKAATNGLAQSVAFEARNDDQVTLENGETMKMKLRVNSVMPGLVSTPFTWNQARGVIGLRPWQCCSEPYRNSSVMECGAALAANKATVVSSTLLCEGSECSCPTVAADDPIIPQMLAQAGLDKFILQPEEIATAIVSLSDNQRSAGITASEVTVDNGDHAGLP